MTPSALGCKLQHAHTLKLQLQPPWGGYAKSFHSRQKSQNPTNRRFVLVILSQIFWVFMDSEIKNTPMGRKHPGLRSKPWPSFRMSVHESGIQYTIYSCLVPMATATEAASVNKNECDQLPTRKYKSSHIRFFSISLSDMFCITKQDLECRLYLPSPTLLRFPWESPLSLCFQCRTQQWEERRRRTI